MKAVTVVIPAYNEQEHIADTIRAVKKRGFAEEIIVVNDGSQDSTGERARAEGVTVLDLNPNQGKGEALNSSIPYINGEIVVFLDADLGECAGQGELLIKPVMEGQADLAVARFPRPRKKGGFGLVKGLAARAIRRAGMEVTEPLSGQRAMTRKLLLDVLPLSSGFGLEVGMSIRALRRGYRIVEVDTTMTHAETGRDLQGFWHRGRQFLDVLKVIIKEAKGVGT